MGCETSQPGIGVTWVTLGNEKSERYLRAVVLAGGRPIPLLANRPWMDDLEDIRGIVFTGGADVDPQLYGEDNLGLSRATNRKRDEFELKALRNCMHRGLPVLAICRGLQFVNAALGGSLIQDIRSVIRHGPTGEQSSFHDVDVVEGTRLAEVVGKAGGTRVNSRHHQGVDLPRVAPPLRVTARAPDGIVEGLELRDGGFLIAVQCHPEYLDEVPSLAGVFAALVAAASS